MDRLLFDVDGPTLHVGPFQDTTTLDENALIDRSDCPNQRAKKLLDIHHFNQPRIEVFACHRCVPLRLAIDPESIRQHFDLSDRLDDVTDEQLLSVAHDCVVDDRLYEVFHEILIQLIMEKFGFDPDSDEELEDDDEDEDF